MLRARLEHIASCKLIEPIHHSASAPGIGRHSERAFLCSLKVLSNKIVEGTIYVVESCATFAAIKSRLNDGIAASMSFPGAGKLYVNIANEIKIGGCIILDVSSGSFKRATISK